MVTVLEFNPTLGSSWQPAIASPSTRVLSTRLSKINF